MVYKYKFIQDGYTISNGARFLQLLQTILGDDWRKWNEHEKFQSVLEIAHQHIFLRPDEYKKGKGLELRIQFLTHSEKQSKETKAKRNSYNDVLEEAHHIGLINQETYWKLKS
jgi:hypothetical protein